ncbi:BamA/TamA family outer membrane protein [Spirosoma sp. KCTC 42546]|uniref:translocation and assembly module lipoprotein TamL n=1 Tax=Spirosoma sp. KCTC 42546 TaxID=2520506 RepID=UPI001159E825|nr:BamA/TamA family outer membrane protein [Spirosoma sp. KCTC 42546]QDK79102.1 BamA/TamA family outer membrane protein [Spirosoma sp. KCTC 42546]
MNNVKWIIENGRRSHRRHHYSFYIIHCALIFSLSGCLSSKKLRTNEYILTAQTVRGNRAIPTESLESLIPQKPNRRILALPITPPLWFYQLGLSRYNREEALRALQAKTNEFEQQSQQLADQPQALKKLNRKYGRKLKHLRLKAEEGNWLMRNLGEPPSYFAESDAKANATKMQKYLADKGFFNAKTAYSLDTLRRRQIRVNYLITENEGFYLRNITYSIADPRVDSIVRQSFDKSRLQTGERFDFDNMAGERVRIESLLRDQGYFTFSRQYIRATDVDTIRRGNDRRFYDKLEPGDSTRRNVDIALQIVNPPGKSAHPIYHIGDVEVRISPDIDASGASFVQGVATALDTVRRNGITYLLGGRDISARLLDSKIHIRQGELYSQTNYRETQRQLFLLNQFKFVNLNFTDTTRRQLRTLITASPLDKYEATAEGGLTGLLYQGQSYPGGFGSLVFRVRNMFGGLETFETSVRYGIEAQTGFVNDPNNPGRAVYSSQELGISSSLIFPQILFPGALRFRFNPYAPRTQVSLSFNNTFRPDFRRSLLRATMAYNWQTTPAKQFSFLIADINLINAGPGNSKIISDVFQAQLDSLRKQGSTVYLSFRRSISSSFSFAYTYNTNTPGQNRRANFLRAVVESGGTTLNFFTDSQLRKFFNTTDSTGLQFYKYLRFNVDYRHYIPLRTRITLAFRVNTGLVYGYGSNRTAPYEKLFFAGGSNSIRAWLPRRLGPGSAWPQTADGKPVFNPDYKDQEQFLYTVEKPGDMIIEGSAELRGRLFHLGADVNGAIFVDAGNVWTISNNANRPSTAFALNTFIPQIAVGTGVGLRFDFSFFVIRFDGGIKVWDPARQYFSEVDGKIVDKRFILPEFSLSKLSSGPNPLVINFGIGYPF